MAQRAKDLVRCRWQRRADQRGVRLDRGSVAGSVLDDHDQPHRSLVVRREPISLPDVAPISVLKVEHQAIDLEVEDLSRAKQAKVSRLAVLTGRHLKSRLPRWMGDGQQLPRNGQLPCVAEGRRAPAIDLDDDVERDCLGYGAERVQPDAGLALLDAAHGVWGDSRSSTDLCATHRVLGTGRGDFASRLGRLGLRATLSGRDHVPMIAGGAYWPLIRRSVGRGVPWTGPWVVNADGSGGGSGAAGVPRE